MVRLVEPCLLGGFPGLSTSDFLFSNIFMWLFWVQCWHSENSLMPASLLLFGTLSPPKRLFWQYGRGPSCVFWQGWAPWRAAHICSTAWVMPQCSVHLKILHISKQKVLQKCLTYLTPKELDCPQCLKVLHNTPNEFYTWQILMLEDV